MPAPIGNNGPVRPLGNTTPADNTGPTPAPATPGPATFTPPVANGAAVINAATPGTGFVPAPGQPAAGNAGPVATPAHVAGTPLSLADFKAMVPPTVDVTKYEGLAAAFKDLSKDDRKSALKYTDSLHQYGLTKYLKDTSGGGGGFFSGLGNAIGEALFGGHR